MNPKEHKSKEQKKDQKNLQNKPQLLNRNEIEIDGHLSSSDSLAHY